MRELFDACADHPIVFAALCLVVAYSVEEIARALVYRPRSPRPAFISLTRLKFKNAYVSTDKIVAFYVDQFPENTADVLFVQLIDGKFVHAEPTPANWSALLTLAEVEHTK